MVSLQGNCMLVMLSRVGWCSVRDTADIATRSCSSTGSKLLTLRISYHLLEQQTLQQLGSGPMCSPDAWHCLQSMLCYTAGSARHLQDITAENKKTSYAVPKPDGRRARWVQIVAIWC